jgi:hypothetical protein
VDNVEISRVGGDMRKAARAALALEGGLKAQLRRVRRLKACLAQAQADEKVAPAAMGIEAAAGAQLVEVPELFPEAVELHPAAPPASFGVPGATFRLGDTEYCLGSRRGDGMIDVSYRRDGCDLESVWTTRKLFVISLARTHGSPAVISAINGLTSDPERAESDWDFVAGSSLDRREAMLRVALHWFARRQDVLFVLGLCESEAPR